MASTSAFFSAKMSTCPKRPALVRGYHPESPSIDPYHHLSSWELWELGTSLVQLYSQVGVSSANTRAGIPSWLPPSRIPPPATVGARSGDPKVRLTSHGPDTAAGSPV